MLCGETATINTSVEDFDNTQVLIYPNPVSNELNINIIENTTSIIIYDILGNIVFEDNNISINNKIYKINTNELALGTYLIETKINNSSQIIKFFKQ